MLFTDILVEVKVEITCNRLLIDYQTRGYVYLIHIGIYFIAFTYESYNIVP